MTWSISREIKKIMSGNTSPFDSENVWLCFKVKSIVGTGHRIYDVFSKKMKILQKAKLFSNIKFKSLNERSYNYSIVFCKFSDA